MWRPESNRCQCEVWEVCPKCMSNKPCRCGEYETCPTCIEEFRQRHAGDDVRKDAPSEADEAELNTKS